MHSLRSLLALILFAEATLTTALPADNFELEALSTTTPLLSTRGYDLASSGAPSKGVLCPAQPASRAAPNGYPEFPYSPNQIKAAFIAGAKQAAAEKQIGDRKPALTPSTLSKQHYKPEKETNSQEEPQKSILISLLIGRTFLFHVAHKTKNSQSRQTGKCLGTRQKT